MGVRVVVIVMYPLLKGALRVLEKRVLYDPRGDEQYELDDEAWELLSRCTGRNSLEDIIRSTGGREKEARELLGFLVEEGLIVDRHIPGAPRKHETVAGPLPSLRYLQLHVTEKCNLDCRHCYLGRKGRTSLSPALAKKAVEEFSGFGLKLLVTGGEPLLYPGIWALLEHAKRFPIRVELLSNGTLITEDAAEKLSGYVDCVQVSLDGLKEGHDLMRGRGSFARALEGVENASKYLDVSIATMIHSGNLPEFQALEKLVRRLGAAEWSLDVPSEKGNMLTNRGLAVDYAEAAKIFENYGYGSGTHEGDGSYSCGSHICSISPQGEVSKCGFFTDSVGNVADKPLLDCWDRILEGYLPKTRELDCAGCGVVDECRGGCRYRAKTSGSFLGRDPFMCQLYQKA